MNNYLEKFKTDSQKSIEAFKTDISGLRTGRATPSLVENIMVESYGQKMPLIQLASINSPDPKTIVIQPWDKGNLKEIEKALTASNLGATPNVAENLIRLILPSPTEETRKEIIKMLHKKLEDGRISVKKIREDAKEKITAAEKNGEIGEDDKFKQLEQLDEEVKKRNDELKEISDKKENEILTI